MSKPLILDLKEKLEELNNSSLNLEIIQGKVEVTSNSFGRFKPDYETIENEKEIVGSFLIGGVSTFNNVKMQLTPCVTGIGETYSTINEVICKSSSDATIYVTIGVLTKKKTS